MSKRNFVVSPLNEYINCHEVEGSFCGSNGQCCLCQEWIDEKSCYPELVRSHNGFAICPKCGSSYGKDALTGEEYKAIKIDIINRMHV